MIQHIVKFNEDLRTMTKQGQISEEAASIRALIDLSDLATVMPIERAVQRTIIDKLEDEREQQAILNAIELNFKEDKMSDRFIKFNDEQLDAKQVMMLQDLARLLLKMSKRKLKYKNSLTIILIVIHSLRVGFGLIDRNILNKLD